MENGAAAALRTVHRRPTTVDDLIGLRRLWALSVAGVTEKN